MVIQCTESSLICIGAFVVAKSWQVGKGLKGVAGQNTSCGEREHLRDQCRVHRAMTTFHMLRLAYLKYLQWIVVFERHCSLALVADLPLDLAPAPAPGMQLAVRLAADAAGSLSVWRGG